MSNSAFTPTKTEITTEVPVNVPVVEATELYTVTVSQGTLSSQRVFKSRSGDRLIIQGNLVFSAGNASTSPVEISLPSGLTADLSKINTGTGALGGHIGSAGILDVSAAKMVSLTAWTNSTNFGFSVNGSSENLRGADIGAGDYVNFFVSIPISQWAGSGTTTLATRAVEEYAFNTSESTTTSDTTSFGYGPNGAVIQNITASLARRVQFQSNIQSSDNISVEISADRITWIPVGGLLNGQVVDTFRFDGANLCGIGLSSTPGFTNQVDVQFGALRTTTASWAGVISTYYWRVRKVSGGAQVGYPVSARNIVGDTSGTSAASGIIGEIKSVSGGTGTFANGANITSTVTSLSLTAGTWMITAGVQASGTTMNYWRISLSTTTGFNMANAVQPQPPVTGGYTSVGMVSSIFTFSSTTTVNLIENHWIATGTNTWTDANIVAIRIA